MPTAIQSSWLLFWFKHKETLCAGFEDKPNHMNTKPCVKKRKCINTPHQRHQVKRCQWSQKQEKNAATGNSGFETNKEGRVERMCAKSNASRMVHNFECQSSCEQAAFLSSAQLPKISALVCWQKVRSWIAIMRSSDSCEHPVVCAATGVSGCVVV